MHIAKPYYFDSFRCLAGSCPDSCCKEWEVQVDGVADQIGNLADTVMQQLSSCGVLLAAARKPFAPLLTPCIPSVLRKNEMTHHPPHTFPVCGGFLSPGRLL